LEENKIKEMNIYERLLEIQSELKAPKSQKNTFGNYNYRSCEDILEAVKPLCKKYRSLLYLRDNLELVGDRYYIKATACLTNIDNKDEYIVTTAYARESETKKGMDDSQVTGATSSYARKYCLNALFDIDDTKDADTNEFQTQNTFKKEEPKEAAVKSSGLVTEAQRKRLFAISKGNNDVIKNVIEQYGYTTSKDISFKDYEEICEKVSKIVENGK
jgi:hypothetical protein